MSQSPRPLVRGVVAPVVVVLAAVLAVIVPTGSASAADETGASTSTSTTLRVPADGGVTLAATLTGASPMAARPTVVEFTPYGTSGKSYSVSDDFNYLLVQIRGTGDSDGTFDALGPQGQQDVANTLQWACDQPWSNGSLAVAGFSASAIMIFNSLHETLPCVKAAVLRSGTFELYRDLLVPGGIPNTIPGLAVLGMIGAPALMEGPDRLQRNPLSALTTILGLATAGLNAGLLHPKLDDFWAQRGFRGDVNQIPTLFVDGAFDVEPRGDYMGFRQLQSEGADPHLLVVGGHDGAPAGTDNGVAEIDKWFDHYLRGVDNGVDSEPAVQMLLPNGDREDMLKGDFVRYDTSSWPAPDTAWTSLALSPEKSGAAKSINDGSLTLDAPATVTKQSYLAFTSLPTNSDPNTIATVAGGNGGPLNQLFDFVPALSDMDLSNATGLTYTSAPLSSAVTAVGPATLDVRLASTSPNSNIWAVISDVSPDGNAHPMAVGRLNTQFPGIVESKSIYDSEGTLVNPYGDYTNASAAPILKARDYHVEFWPFANHFQAGHRIQLSIIGQSALSMPSLPALNTISIGGDSGSRLVFPAVADSDLPAALGAPGQDAEPTTTQPAPQRSKHSATSAAVPGNCFGTCRWTDARRDAPARADLLHAKVRVAKRAFVVRFHLRNLKANGAFVLGAGVAGWGTNYFVHKRGHRIVVKEQTVSEVQVYKKVRCRKATVKWNPRTDRIRARFPFRCSGGTGDGVINGIVFHAHGATDRMGRVYFKP